MAARHTTAPRPRASTPAHPDRYLIQRRRAYFFQRQVPRQHRAAMGCTNFTRSLGTSDLRTARARRDRLNAEYEAMIASLEPAVDTWSPKGLIQTARHARLHNTPEVFEAEVARIAAHQPTLLQVTEPTLVGAIERGAEIATGTEAGPLFSEAVREHLEWLAARAVPSSVAFRRRVLETVSARLGDPAMASVTRRSMAKWVTEVVAANKSLSPKSKSNCVGEAAAFGRWAVDSGHWVENHAGNLRSLLRGSTRGTSTEPTVRPWRPDEVRELFTRMVAELPSDDPLHALVRIAAYSGMRREEIASLRGRDIEVVDGVTVMQVREGKSAAAVRAVPVHSAVVHLLADVAPGDYVVPGLNGSGPDGRRAHAAGSRFSALKRAWGVDPALNFHGLRRAFLKRLESAGVPQNIAETLVGHARRSLSYGRYSDGADVQVLRDAVERVTYGVEVSA
jgi:integrase